MTGKPIAVCLCSVLIAACTSGSSAPETETLSISVREGTVLSFDVAPDGKSIVFDLLGQLWLLPAAGGEARALTDAVRDTAEDLDPSFSPDGRQVVFRAERNGRTGLWLLDVAQGTTRQLTQLAYADGYEGSAAWSPDGQLIAFERNIAPDSANPVPRKTIVLLDVATAQTRELQIEGLKVPRARQPAWSADGRRIAFMSEGPDGRRVWIVDATGGKATPVTSEKVRAFAPALSPDGHTVAFIARDSAQRDQVWLQEIGGTPKRLTNHDDVAPTRVRWSADGASLFYSADGRLWRLTANGGTPAEIPFTATLTLTRPQHTVTAARFPEPGKAEPARAFAGLALSPDGQTIAALALAKLWLIPVGGAARSITSVPHTARHLAWTRDGKGVAWSAGPWLDEDLFITDVQTGTSRRITRLPGREMLPAFSPDGKYLSFVHGVGEGALRVVDAAGTTVVSDTSHTRNLGPVSASWSASNVETPQWTPASDALLVSNDWSDRQPTTGRLIPLVGKGETIARFPDAPIFATWLKNNSLVFVRHDRLWSVRFDRGGVLDTPRPLGDVPAFYASAADDGAVLYISEDGLHVRSAGGTERQLGWPITFTPPVAPSLLIRNVRIVDDVAAAATSPKDILVEGGRIKRIGEAGGIKAAGAKELDAGGRFAIAGLIDLHAHNYMPQLLPGFLYFGVTTVRDQGSWIGPLVAYAELYEAGVLPGSRISYGGFQYYSDWRFDEDQGRGVEPEADTMHVRRSVALASAFGAQHIKTRTFRRWDINAKMVREAHQRGMRATGHCAHQLPLVAAGIDSKEHIGVCGGRGHGPLYMLGDMTLYDDQIQLYRAANIGVVPTISYFSLASQLSAQPTLLDADTEITPFLPDKSTLAWMKEMDPETRAEWTRAARQARTAAAKLARAGVTIGTGTDIWQVPTGVHMELEELVAAGLTPAQALRAATRNAARILGAERDLGSIEAGKLADLVILDADPLTDIRNTRKIWSVLQAGRPIERQTLQARAAALEKAAF